MGLAIVISRWWGVSGLIVSQVRELPVLLTLERANPAYARTYYVRN